MSWKHSGFSVHNQVRLAEGDAQAAEPRVRYMMRPAVSLSRVVLQPDQEQVVYYPKPAGDEGAGATAERADALEFVARVLAQIPEPSQHLVRNSERDIPRLSGFRRIPRNSQGLYC